MIIPRDITQIFITLLITASESLSSGCHGFQYPEDGPACIILNMNATLTITQTGDTPRQVTSTLSDAKVNKGTCAEEGENLANLNLDITGTLPASISFFFSKTENKVVLMDVLVKFDPDDIFKNNDKGLQVTTEEGKTRLSDDTFSYFCEEERDIPFAPVNTSMFTYEFGMTVNNVVIQAFNIKNGNLSEAEYCQAEQSTTVEATTSGGTSEEQTTQPNEPTGSTSDMTTIETNTSTTEVGTTEATTSVTVVPTVVPTTPSITPAPGNPPVQTYSVDGENGTCILMTGGIQFTIQYNATNEKKTKVIGIPPMNQVTISGNCNDLQANKTSQSIDLMFYDDWNVKISFSNYDDQTTEKYYLSEIDLTANLSTELFPDIASPVMQKVVKTFTEKTVSASVQGSYRCTEELEFILNQDFSMDTFNLQFAAFQKNITNFKDTDLYQCKSDVKSNSDIPIAVGASLGGLVVVVFVAYLVGRRCKSRNGYDTI